MPVIKSAKKKLRQDKKRTAQNKKVKNLLKTVLKKAKETPSEKKIREAVKIVDKAAKNHIIHKNKAARIKSALSKLLNKKSPAPKPVKTEKPSSPKAKVTKQKK